LQKSENRHSVQEKGGNTSQNRGREERKFSRRNKNGRKETDQGGGDDLLIQDSQGRKGKEKKKSYSNKGRRG